jgi:FSR family fosmidomycin resistance protein-like MFS transporter
MRLLSIRSPGVKLALLSLMHFLTDGLCSYLIFSKLYPDNPQNAFFVFIGYNILAFVTQSPVGIFIDRYNKPKIFLFVSMVTMLLGYAFSNFWILSVVLIGISNSIFHVAGGKYVTDKSGNDISHLGIFVSTGAVGLVLGQKYFSFTLMPYIFFTILIISGAIIIFSDDSETKTYSEEYQNGKDPTLALLAVIGVVAIRSFVGKIVAPDFDLTGHMFLLLSLATALGKAMGGVFSKRFGIRPTTYVSMIVAALCLTLGAGSIISFIIGVFAFNFSMPITLYYANILLKGQEGFAFGTLAASLIPGFFLAVSCTYSITFKIVTAVLCVISMFTIIIISKKINNHDRSLTFDCNP